MKRKRKQKIVKSKSEKWFEPPKPHIIVCDLRDYRFTCELNDMGYGSLFGIGLFTSLIISPTEGIIRPPIEGVERLLFSKTIKDEMCRIGTEKNCKVTIDFNEPMKNWRFEFDKGEFAIMFY